MRHSLAIFSFLTGAAVADTIQFVFPGGIEGPSPVATIESVEGSTTSAVVGCPTGTSIEDCGFGAGLDVEIIGGTRYQASMSAGTIYVSYGCDGYNSVANTMTCTAEMAGQDTQTAVLSGSDVAFIAATVVEGTELLSGGVSASASTSAVNASASPTSKTSAAAINSGMHTSIASGTAAAGSHASGAASTTGSSSVAQSTGAAARFGIEGAALLALAGAAAVNAL
ncbi:uncharacterized protein M421DRAFT_425809 [Didymella exigua CBS 183.55]|uniref:GPI anchored protein n=1 Tax=Didymella exigua CBS 183.55 TaxID=1150837 RepID=A0A6A5R5P9_9PLEO|nr:uncharacterized protein M421DRAFT_425809 [Didymella exigua CBS 183.55]KAF1923435.1 hypothetical protein M421DRAFT_425809 [Didymella exigua CBS 183.55]